MAENSGSNNFLAFIVGGLVVVVVVLFLAMGGVDLFRGGGDSDIDVEVELPAAPGDGGSN